MEGEGILKKNKNLTPEQKQYQEFSQAREPKRPIFINCIKAFLVGGTICIIGQVLQLIFVKYFNFTNESAGSPTSAVLIIMSALITGLGFYDVIAQWAGAGTAVPVTGFANTMTSAAIEHKSEGYVLGVGGNMFKIAGPVIVYGVFSAFIISIIRAIINILVGVV